jgi:hypothetical protein
MAVVPSAAGERAGTAVGAGVVEALTVPISIEVVPGMETPKVDNTPEVMDAVVANTTSYVVQLAGTVKFRLVRVKVLPLDGAQLD